QPRLVDLRQGGARHRLRVPRCEELLRRPAEFPLDTFDNLLGGPRGNGILQPFQLAPELLGKEVRENANQLPDLDEEAIELDDGVLDASRVDAMSLQQVSPVCVRAKKGPAQPQAEVAREYAKGDAIRPREAEARPSVAR